METSTLQQGAVVDRYTIDGVVGQGGMAMVLRVRHNQLGTHHALKVLTIASASITERLVQEGRLQASLRHANVVAVTDLVVLPSGSPGLIMEFVEGPTLEQLLAGHRLSLDQIDVLARGILEGVAEAHRRGILHRDLKPANILLEPADGTYVPKVADFGLAKVLAGDGSGGRTRTGATMGTPNYMAPEQVRDAKGVGHGADVFALGAILYELVTGHRAFDGDDILETLNDVAHGRFVPVRNRVPDLPDAMEAAITGALQVDSADRPASVEELLALWTADGRVLPHGTVFPGVERVILPHTASSETWASEASTMNQRVVPPLSDSAPPVSDPGSRTPGRWVVLAGGGALLAVLFATTLGLAALAVGIWYAAGPRGAAPVVAVAEAPATAAGSTPDTGSPGPVANGVANGVGIDGQLQVPIAPVPAPAPEPASPSEPPVEPVAASDPSGEGPPSTVTISRVGHQPDSAVVRVSEEPPADADPLDPELTPMLASPDPAERRQGFMHLLERHDPEAWLLVRKALRDEPDGTTRRAMWVAVLDLWNRRLGDADQLQRVIGRQLAKGHPTYAVEAAEALGRYGDRPELLYPGLRRSEPQVLVATLAAVMHVQPRAGGDFAPLVAPLTESSNRRVRDRAIAAYSKL